MPRYLELYLAVTGDNCFELVRNMIGQDDKKEELIDLCEKIGERVAVMAASKSPHADCHSGNFILGSDKKVVAIDFRRIAEADLHPLTNFVEKLLITFSKKMADAEPSVIKDAVEVYIRCIQAFLKKAASNPSEIDHVWTFLAIGPESQNGKTVKGFLREVQTHIPAD